MFGVIFVLFSFFIYDNLTPSSRRIIGTFFFPGMKKIRTKLGDRNKIRILAFEAQI